MYFQEKTSGKPKQQDLPQPGPTSPWTAFVDGRLSSSSSATVMNMRNNPNPTYSWQLKNTHTRIWYRFIPSTSILYCICILKRYVIDTLPINFTIFNNRKTSGWTAFQEHQPPQKRTHIPSLAFTPTGGPVWSAVWLYQMSQPSHGGQHRCSSEEGCESCQSQVIHGIRRCLKRKKRNSKGLLYVAVVPSTSNVAHFWAFCVIYINKYI